jgi:hypothetical protein
MARFALGKLVATPGALDALTTAGESPSTFLSRHLSEDWGDVDQDDWKANDQAILNETRILSAYTLSTGVKIWLITEADRSSTCILLPEEY